MIGIVVVSHGKLAHELVAAAEHVVGKLWRARVVSIDSDDDLDLKREQILAAVKACDAGRGVIVLTDMFGGTPSNLVLSIRGSVPMEIVSGANLPMLIKLAEIREVLSLEEAAIAAAEAGRKYVTIASELFARLP
ncbi:MAG: PTS sugar transporter subunit IIA [Hyphomonas sp.]